MSDNNGLKNVYESIYVENASFEIDPQKHKEIRKKSKIYNLYKGTTNPGEKEAAKRKLKSPILPDVKKEEYVTERHMTASERAKEERIGKKTKSAKTSMMQQYGPEKGEKIYYAWKRKQAMKEAFVDPETGEAPSGRSPIENVSYHPKKSVRRKAMGAFAHQMGKEYGGKWKAKTKDPTTNENFDYNDAYDYIIETLVDDDFAEDYESAENMFESMSSEFVSAILEEYLEEKARGTRPKRTVHAYDVDETLFGHGKKGKPNVQVHVKDSSGKRVQSLSNQEFNTHKLPSGHSYDFSEFQSAKKFKETSSPNKKVIKDLKRKQARGQNVHLITARSKFDNPSEFQGHLKKHGVDVSKSKIHYTGGMKGGDIGKKKVDVANAVAKQSGSKNIHMYDDAAKVHKAFEKEKTSSSTGIKTHMVAPDKSGESRVRSYQATKGGTTGGPQKTIKQTQRARKKARKGMREEMTAYEYWKQFID